VSPRLRPALSAALLGALLLSGCASGGWEARTEPHAAPVGAVHAGFVPQATPSPEATIAPPAGSWGDLRPAPGYRVVLLTTGSDEPTETLRTAVTDWAGEVGADLRTVRADDDVIAGAVEAMNMNPDLIVIVGEDLIDPMALVTANHLDRQFLVVGAELAEPTANVTAADWTGAAFRGEGLGTSSSYDAATFTPERAAAAVRAGVASVLSGMTGIVLWID
jgi:hypothetical protein